MTKQLNKNHVFFTLAQQTCALLSKQKKTLTCAESITGGLISSTLTKIPGASKVFWGGFVVYTIDAKQKLLDISPQFITQNGVISTALAKMMAKNALKKSMCDYALALTGLAGSRGTSSKNLYENSNEPPVGTVCFACAEKKDTIKLYAQTEHFLGTRTEIQTQAGITGLQFLLHIMQ